MKKSTRGSPSKERGNRSPGQTQITVTIETPRGSRNKLKYDPARRMYQLSKVLPEGMVFPHDFGFVPGTKAEDGDPLDVLVLTDEPLFPGCLVECRLIGVIEMEQDVEGAMTRNDRLIAAAQASLLYADVNDLSGLNPTILGQIEAFFVNYQNVRGIKVNILDRRGPDRARTILQRSRTK
ncbi:MAG: hypothetical protein JWO80_1141 [Bryobacterales bacterium]|nr:hypothetical protein [Bryobacterales bacterium]